MTVSFSKSTSVLHASIRENARRARLAGDEQVATYWHGREERFQEVLQRANRAALEYAQRWAGVTRSGYHGTQVDSRAMGRFEQAILQPPKPDIRPAAKILEAARERDATPEAAS